MSYPGYNALSESQQRVVELFTAGWGEGQDDFRDAAADMVIECLALACPDHYHPRDTSAIETKYVETLLHYQGCKKRYDAALSVNEKNLWRWPMRRLEQKLARLREQAGEV